MRTSAKRRLLLLATALVVFAGGCSPGGELSDPGQQASEEGGEPQKEAPPFAAFSKSEVKIIDSQDRPEAGTKGAEDAEAVVVLVNGYYQDAFIDPERWGDGAHPGLPNYFTEEAKTQVLPRIGSMALNGLSKDVRSVKIDKQVISKISIYYDGDLNAPIAVADTDFEATGTPAAEGADPIKIVHKATFWMQKEGDGFKISEFKADINASQGAA